jgi:3-phosphoshikimate 1-carboxyvinyltransferase
VRGEIRVPGDKSITHRALMLAAAAEGTSRIRGALTGADCRSTAEVLRALGAEIPDLIATAGELRIESRGLLGWRAPERMLDCGNSGTTARLMLGWLAGRPFCSALTGDASLRGRPMRRVSEPLSAMGAGIRELELADRLPLEICGGALKGMEFESPTASAQVKSALLFAGVSAGVPVVVHEPYRSRDHTERMLCGAGVMVHSEQVDAGWRVELAGGAARPMPLDFDVPGDPSSAAFFIALALLADRGELCIRGVGTNPTRTGMFRALARMGAFVELHDEREQGGEPVADLVVRPARLKGARITGPEMPALIDEVPILAVLAARAEGTTRFSGAHELRAKETDRIAALVSNLRAVGARAEELPDGMAIVGGDQPLRGRVRSYGDHRIAMAFGVLAALPGNQIEIDDTDCADVSFPGFWTLLQQLTAGAGHAPAAADLAEVVHAPPPEGIVIAIDGPAGSGKSSTARAVAQALGYRHLDSGAFYRALTLAALRAGIAPERWSELTEAELEALGVDALPTGTGYQVRIAEVAVGEEIRTPEVNAHVSAMAAVPAVRAWLLHALRRAGRQGALVADGRDIGTVVFPEAELKVFLGCSPFERARRRLIEQGTPAPSAEQLAAEAERLVQRDTLDSTRETAPLLRAPDAVMLDTTDLAFDAQVAAIVRLAHAREPR